MLQAAGRQDGLGLAGWWRADHLAQVLGFDQRASGDPFRFGCLNTGKE
jgi:hypothetical protein